MAEEERILDEREEVIQDGEHYVKVTTVKKERVELEEVSLGLDDFVGEGQKKAFTAEELQAFTEVLEQEGLSKRVNTTKRVVFEEEEKHEMNDEEIVDHLMNKMYK